MNPVEIKCIWQTFEIFHFSILQFCSVKIFLFNMLKFISKVELKIHDGKNFSVNVKMKKNHVPLRSNRIVIQIFFFLLFNLIIVKSNKLESNNFSIDPNDPANVCFLWLEFYSIFFFFINSLSLSVAFG